jgi:hypothetical protein
VVSGPRFEPANSVIDRASLCSEVAEQSHIVIHN